ncbi:hypothetical protein E4U26_003946 [Claviceps purpurea]|nr:hypothetical protein E4U26_003946 [Claviceps purpurea]
MPRMSTRSSTARSRSEEREAEEASPMGWDPGPSPSLLLSDLLPVSPLAREQQAPCAPRTDEAY